MTQKQKTVRWAAWAAVLVAIAFSTGALPALAQQLGAGMDRTGTVGIESDAERKLFFALICTCGCPRETLGTCTCGFAHARRDELRAELAAGRDMQTIVAAYADRFGTQALAVPPNTGGQRALYLVPLGLIILGAVGVITTVRRWRRQNDAREASEAKTKKKRGAGGPETRDAYDDKLDEELRALDDEDPR